MVCGGILNLVGGWGFICTAFDLLPVPDVLAFSCIFDVGFYFVVGLLT